MKYLEARLVEQAREVGRVSLENGTVPARPSLPEAAQANMEAFLEYLLMVLPGEEVDAEEILAAQMAARADAKGITYQRMYSFLSQIFDYGNTDIEKRFIFYRRLVPLLEFGREREGVDVSKIELTHYALKGQGERNLPLGGNEKPKLQPTTEAGSGGVQDKEKALLAEIIERVNDLFEGDLTDEDKLVYVNNVIKGKLMQSETLVQQASNNTKEQFASSPDFDREVLGAIMDALSAHTNMSTQALNSEQVREGLKDILLGPAQLWESLRKKGEGSVSVGNA